MYHSSIKKINANINSIKAIIIDYTIKNKNFYNIAKHGIFIDHQYIK